MRSKVNFQYVHLTRLYYWLLVMTWMEIKNYKSFFLYTFLPEQNCINYLKKKKFTVLQLENSADIFQRLCILLLIAVDAFLPVYCFHFELLVKKFQIVGNCFNFPRRNCYWTWMLLWYVKLWGSFNSERLICVN